MSTIVVTATSSGDCIDPGWLRPGCLVLDVGVPSDIRRAAAGPRRCSDSLRRIFPRARGDAPRLVLPAVLHGIVPSCLGETMVLALENRADSFSIGRDLDLDRIREIGRLAEAHGFVFSQALATGQSLSIEARTQFLKVRSQARAGRDRRTPFRCDDRDRPLPGSILRRRSTSPRLAGPAAATA